MTAMLRGGHDRGAVTAELAVVLPVVIVLLAVVTGVLTAATTGVRLEGATAQAARMAGRGEESAATDRVVEAVPRSRAHLVWRGDLVCVRSSASVRVLGIIETPVRAVACAPTGGR